MGWGFRVSCSDCNHEWEGIETSFRFGSWSTFEHPNIHDGFRAWFCPRCYFRLYVPPSIERIVWRRWYARFLKGCEDGSAFLRGVAAEVDVALSRGKFYVPLPVALEPPVCPDCQQAFEDSGEGVSDRSVGPCCGNRGAVLNGV
jgi:hypothetical protein